MPATRYEARGLDVYARGPRGGRRWIASYSKASTAREVATYLNDKAGK